MPTFVHGSKAALYAGGYDMTPYTSSVKTASAVDKSDANTLGLTSKSSVPGLKNPTLSWDGFFDASTGASHERLRAILGAAGQVFTYYPAGDSPGNVAELAKGYGAKYDEGNTMNSTVTAGA